MTVLFVVCPSLSYLNEFLILRKSLASDIQINFRRCILNRNAKAFRSFPPYTLTEHEIGLQSDYQFSVDLQIRNTGVFLMLALEWKKKKREITNLDLFWPSFIQNSLILPKRYFPVTVCGEEESCWNLGLQRLWKGQSRRCLHDEVIFLSWNGLLFSSSFFALLDF